MFNIFKKKRFNYTNLLISVIVVMTIGLITVFFFSTRKVGENGMRGKVEVSEEQKLIDENREALERVKTESEGVLRKIDKEDHTIGELGAPVELIVYSDFQCPFCADFAKTVKRVKDEFGNKIVIAYRHFPLTSIHESALAAAVASECAAEQGKFWEMHDKLFTDNEADRMSVVQFKTDAKELKLNMTKFNKCLDTEKYKDEVMSEMLEARSVGITGTPGSFLNGQPLPGAYPYEDFTDSGGYQRKGMKSLVERTLNNLNK